MNEQPQPAPVDNPTPAPSPAEPPAGPPVPAMSPPPTDSPAKPPKPRLPLIDLLFKYKVQAILVGVGLLLLIGALVYYVGFNGNNAAKAPNNSNDTSLQNEETLETGSAETSTDTPSDTTQPTDAQPTDPPAGGVTSGGGSSSGGTASTGKTYEISYSNTCFDPANRTIKNGDTIKFINNSKTRNMWPASDNHPSHSLYPEFNPNKSFAPGESWSFTFTKVGAWGYHDHLKANCTGTITVTS